MLYSRHVGPQEFPNQHLSITTISYCLHSFTCSKEQDCPNGIVYQLRTNEVDMKDSDQSYAHNHQSQGHKETACPQLSELIKIFQLSCFNCTQINIVEKCSILFFGGSLIHTVAFLLFINVQPKNIVSSIYSLNSWACLLFVASKFHCWTRNAMVFVTYATSEGLILQFQIQ